MSAELTRIPEELEVLTGPETRLLIRQWENERCQRFVTVAPQFKDRGGERRLSHSGLILSPNAARELASALLAMAAAIEAAPVDPLPTEQDREDSRMP